MMGLALGGKTFKLKFGHHGANHPIKDLETGKVDIVTENPAHSGPEPATTHGLAPGGGGESSNDTISARLGITAVYGPAHRQARHRQPAPVSKQAVAGLPRWPRIRTSGAGLHTYEPAEQRRRPGHRNRAFDLAGRGHGPDQPRTTQQKQACDVETSEPMTKSPPGTRTVLRAGALVESDTATC